MRINVSQELKMTKAADEKEVKKLMRKCLNLWKAVIKMFGGWKCEICGSTKRIQAHHIETYSVNKGLRYDIYNGVCLCSTCHKFGRFSVHRGFITIYDFMILNRLNDISYLREQRKEKVEITKEWLESNINKLSQYETKKKN